MFLEYFPKLTQIISAILAIWLYKKYATKFTFYLTLLLCVIVIVESIGTYYKITKKPTFHVYHIYSFFEYNLIALMFLSVLKKKININLIKGMIIVINVFYFLTYLYIGLQMYVTPLGSLFVSVYCILFLAELLQSDKILNYKNELSFWVTVGFLIFYLPSIPFFMMLKSMHNRGLFFIIGILVVFMNLFITYGLLCSREKT